MAGLACALRLQEAGIPFQLLESSDRVGGRLKTDLVDGVQLDRGFQVYFDAYPFGKEILDYDALDFRAFRPGALLATPKGLETIDSDQPLVTLRSKAFGLLDKVGMLRLRRFVETRSQEELRNLPDETAEAFLQHFGFDTDFLETFARPFFGGIFLDRSLSVSARQFLFVFKMLAAGRTVLPAKGIEAIPRQMEGKLPPSRVQKHARVESLLKEGGKVVGVRLADRSVLLAAAVVLATPAKEMARLLGRQSQMASRSSTCIYFSAPEPIVDQPYLILNATGLPGPNHIAPLSTVAPEYAPGRHLLSVTWLGDPDLSDEDLAHKTRLAVNPIFPNRGVLQWKHLRTYKIEAAQLIQGVGFFDTKYTMKTDTPNLFLAGEATTNSSIDGALESGVNVARHLIWRLSR